MAQATTGRCPPLSHAGLAPAVAHLRTLLNAAGVDPAQCRLVVGVPDGGAVEAVAAVIDAELARLGAARGPLRTPGGRVVVEHHGMTVAVVVRERPHKIR